MESYLRSVRDAHYRLVQSLTEINTRVVVYPCEPHGVEEYEQQLDIARWVRLWFEERLLD